MAAEQMANGGTRPAPPRPLDEIDHAILRILQTDGRASIRAVAERVHVSRANAYARINRLVEDNVIRGFTARVDHERAGQERPRTSRSRSCRTRGAPCASSSRSCPGRPTSPW